MNGTSGFQEGRSSTSRSSTNRLLHEQQHQFDTGFWHLFPTHDLAVSPQASVRSEKKFLTSFSVDTKPENAATEIDNQR